MIETSPLPLAQMLLEQLRARGPQSFAWFMEQALYHPQHGYYASGRAAIGRKGDFFTNVSVGPIYGKLIAIQIREMWERMDRPQPFTVVEQGAANGDFAHDFLSALDAEFLASVRYVIVEPLPIWKQQQQDRLAEFSNMSWTDSLETLAPFEGVHFSNELLDAFPVQRLVFREGRWIERLVEARGESFGWCDGAPLVGALPPLAEEGVETEICPARLDWLESLAGKLTRGYVLAVDYGFPRDIYHLPERREGTLTGYANHRRVDDVLKNPGEVDLTAHVEFTSLIERSTQLGFEVAGFTDQHHFMAALGLRYFREGEAPQTAAAQKERRGFATLMHPQLMGLSFQALALAKQAPIHPTLVGFALSQRPR